jgi:hypothetical protein
MRLDADVSWRIEVDAPEDLHLALFVRDAYALTGPDSVGPLRNRPPPAGSVPARARADVSRAWQAWWQALLIAHQATSGRPPDGLTASQMVAWRTEPRRTAGVPPDFAGLAASPILQHAAAQAWQAAFQSWWESSPSHHQYPCWRA